MSTAIKQMTADEFLIWRQSQEGTWEFVDGAPRRKFHNPLNLMAGGRGTMPWWLAICCWR